MPSLLRLAANINNHAKSKESLSFYRKKPEEQSKSSICLVYEYAYAAVRGQNRMNSFLE